MTREPRGVVFDYGNVIASFDVRKYFGKITGYTTLSPAELREAMKRPPGLMDLYESGKISSEEFFTEIVRRGKLSITLAEFLPIYSDIFTPIVPTQQLIERLKGHYRIGLLSNTSEWHFEHEIRQNRIFPLFDSVTLSYEVGARKPSPRIYHDALRKLKLAPEECVYIDDITEFAGAATDLGMRGIHYRTPEELIRSLKEAGVRIIEMP